MLFIGCDDKSGGNSDSVTINVTDSIMECDTVYSYMVIDNEIYEFDTVFQNIRYSIKTNCLNDSSLMKQPYTYEEDGKQIISFFGAHNYESKLIMEQNGIEKEYLINMLTFKDSLPDDFMEYATLVSNVFESVENKELIFKAWVSQPESDYSFCFYYTINFNGEIEIKDVEYGL